MAFGRPIDHQNACFQAGPCGGNDTLGATEWMGSERGCATKGGHVVQSRPAADRDGFTSMDRKGGRQGRVGSEGRQAGSPPCGIGASPDEKLRRGSKDSGECAGVAGARLSLLPPSAPRKVRSGRSGGNGTPVEAERVRSARECATRGRHAGQGWPSVNGHVVSRSYLTGRFTHLRSRLGDG